LVLVAVALGVVLATRGHDNAKVSGRVGSVLSAARAAALVRELRSGRATSVAQAVSLPIGVTLPLPVVKALAGLRSVSLNPATFRTLGSGLASVRARVVTAMGNVQSWTAILVMSAGEWKFAQTTLAGS
jgi:hypothetical protein